MRTSPKRRAGAGKQRSGGITRTYPGVVPRVRVNNAPARLHEPRQSDAQVRINNAPAALNEPRQSDARVRVNNAPAGLHEPA